MNDTAFFITATASSISLQYAYLSMTRSLSRCHRR